MTLELELYKDNNLIGAVELEKDNDYTIDELMNLKICKSKVMGCLKFLHHGMVVYCDYIIVNNTRIYRY